MNSRPCLFLVFLAIFGSVYAAPQKCTEAAIMKCESDNRAGRCYYNSKIIKCVNDFKASCNTNLLKDHAASQIGYHAELGKTCPTLPEGKCWLDRLEACLALSPTFVDYRSYKTMGKVKAKWGKPGCELLFSLDKNVTQCLDNLQHFCGTNLAKESIEISRIYFRDAIARCKWVIKQIKAGKSWIG